ncbi:MAG: hypothetical protein DHS20C02_02370 [Micavibrio sp.]|nr:MAG: hypothetical protein DHS20C02_02370 [Micavibrio sp.]
MTQMLKQKAFLIKALISLAIIAVLVMRMDITTIKDLVGHIHVEYWLVALFLMFVQILALALRWSLLINVHGHKMDYSDSLRITLASLLANYLFITSIGGIIVRVALAIQHGISWVQSIAATTLDRLMTLAALLILTVVFLPILFGIVEKEIFQSTLAAIFTFVLAFSVFSLLFLKNVRRHLIFSHRKIAVGYKYLRSIGRNHNLIAQITATSLFAQTAYFAAVYVVTVSTGVDFPLLYFMAVLPMITIVASLPVGYGGWGIREGAFVYGLGLINVPIETAFVVSIQIGLISMIAVLIAGIPALMSGHMQFALKNLKASRAR